MIKVEVHSTRAVIRSQEPLTVGLRGAKVRFAFGGDWESLGKTAVFRQGEKTVTVADIGQEVTIPWEVLTMAGVPVQIGVYGMDASGAVAIPTLWVSTEPVQPGADPEGDPTTEYTQPFWEQILQKTGTMEQLQTDAKSSLVAAINEANRPVQMVYVGMDTDGFNTSHFANEIQRLIDNGIPMACYWHEKDVVAHLSEFQTGGPFVFTTVSDAVAYRIVIHDDNSVECSEMELTKKTDLPTKTSQLKNDSGYLTKAPVTGVNGQTGDVTVSTPVRIMIERLANGLYQPDPPYDEIVELHDQGNLLYCQYENLELPLTSAVPHFYTFSCVHDGKVHKVRIGPSSVTASSEAIASGSGSGAVDAVLYKPQTLTEEQKTQARDNIGACDRGYVDDAIANIDLPTGVEGGNNTFCYELTLEEDVKTVNIPFPVNWGRMIQFNIHAMFPTALSSNMAWQTNIGGSWNSHDALTPSLKGLDLYGIRYVWNDDWTMFSVGRNVANNAYDLAFPKASGDFRPNPGNNVNNFGLFSMTDGVLFPAGTKFDVWGVYAP